MRRGLWPGVVLGVLLTVGPMALELFAEAPKAAEAREEKKEEAERPRWRDAIPIHPACETMPSEGEDKLKGLAVDIGEHGQVEPVKLWFSVEPRNMYPPQS